MFSQLMQLFNLDTKTLLGTLVWGHLAMGIVIYLYEYTSKYKFNFGTIMHNMVTIRFLSTFGYLCLFLRGQIPDIISVNIGNTVLFLCYYLEYGMMLEVSNAYSKKIHVIGAVILAVNLVMFNLVEFLYHDSSLRIATASCVIFLLALPMTILFLTAKHTSKFKKSIGIFYIPLLIALIPRSIEAFSAKIINIAENNYYQTLLFSSLSLLMISNTLIYLLFLKERTDSVIEKMANFDNLTSLMNRHNFFFSGNLFFEKCKRQRRCLSVLFLDIDYFKTVNDRFGHLFGDNVLIRFAEVIKNNIRPKDICCRYGGEEFVVLASTDMDGCENIANRILLCTEEIVFDSEPDFHITTSIGCMVAIPRSDETLENFIYKADKALYEAKQAGRNRIKFAKP